MHQRILTAGTLEAPLDLGVPEALQIHASQLMRFVGRQPILTGDQKTFGYELLYRSGTHNHFSGDPDGASRQMVDSILNMGLATIAPEGKAFINCTRDTLLRGYVTLLPPTSTVVEVLETVEVDDEVFRVCSKLKDAGYQIALDDYMPNPSMDRLLGLADYAKLDFRACGVESLRAIQAHLRLHKLALLAEKVETQAEFDRAKLEGFRYFQGYFFSRPTILQSEAIPTNKLLYVQLLHAVNVSPYNREAVERLLMVEASLCFRLLRLVNSAGMAIRNPVRTVRQALLMLGEDELRKLITVAGAAVLADGVPGSRELIMLALCRARFCELMAGVMQEVAAEQYLIGLLSVMPALLRVTPQQLVGMLPLAPHIVAVLLGSSDQGSLPLRLSEALEAGQWEHSAALVAETTRSEDEVADLHAESVRWSAKQVQNVS